MDYNNYLLIDKHVNGFTKQVQREGYKRFTKQTLKTLLAGSQLHTNCPFFSAKQLEVITRIKYKDTYAQIHNCLGMQLLEVVQAFSPLRHRPTTYKLTYRAHEILLRFKKIVESG